MAGLELQRLSVRWNCSVKSLVIQSRETHFNSIWNLPTRYQMLSEASWTKTDRFWYFVRVEMMFSCRWRNYWKTFNSQSSKPKAAARLWEKSLKSEYCTQNLPICTFVNNDFLIEYFCLDLSLSLKNKHKRCRFEIRDRNRVCISSCRTVIRWSRACGKCLSRGLDSNSGQHKYTGHGCQFTSTHCHHQIDRSKIFLDHISSSRKKWIKWFILAFSIGILLNDLL